MMEKLIKNLNQKKQPKYGVINISKKGRTSAHKLFYTSYIIQDIFNKLYYTSCIIQDIFNNLCYTSSIIQDIFNKLFYTRYI